VEKLLCIEGELTSREFPVGELCIIGRSTAAHVHLDDPAVSRQHAKITRLTNKFVIEDLESGWGTQLNGHYISAAYLRHNDEITIAGTSFRFFDQKRERSLSDEYAKICDAEGQPRIGVDDSHPRYLPTPPDASMSSLTRQIDRVHALSAVGQSASRAVDQRAMLDEVLATMLDLFSHADRAMVAIIGSKDEKLSIQAVAMREGTRDAKFVIAGPLSEQVLVRGRPVIFNPSDAPRAGRAGARPLMVAPMVSREQVLGLIYVDAKPKSAPMTEQDLEVLKCIAANVALSVHNDRLVEQLHTQSQTRHELAAAYEVQRRFLPRRVPKMPGFSFWSHYDPCRDVGGDLYDFINLGAGKLGVVVGDVAGKGLPAALVMAWITSQLRLAAYEESAPDRVLARVNTAFLETKQDEIFVTLLFGVLDWKAQSLALCNAGHIPPLVYRWSTRKVEVVKEGVGMPVGMVADAELQVHTIKLDPGDTVMMVTDGVTEAMNTEERMFGLEGLRSAVGRSLPPAANMVSDVLARMREFVGEAPQYDDITLVALGAEWSSDDEPVTITRGLGWNK
jgi:sigma-B regulation protein RsbU (phosphoserine phosphatase)